MSVSVDAVDYSASSVSLGGTSQKGDWSRTIDPAHRDRVWQGCCRLLPSLQVIVTKNFVRKLKIETGRTWLFLLQQRRRYLCCKCHLFVVTVMSSSGETEAH